MGTSSVFFVLVFGTFLFKGNLPSFQFSSVQSLSRVRLFATPWIAARQASLFITNSRSSPRLASIESVIPSSHLILGRPLFLLPSIPPSIKVFSNESALPMRWPKYWSFSFSIITFTPFGTVHGVLKVRIQKCFAIPFSSGPHSVRPLHRDPINI